MLLHRQKTVIQSGQQQKGDSMIRLSELQKRVYVDKQCVEFTYYLPVGEKNTLEVRFSLIADKLWSVFSIIRVDNSFTRVIYDGAITQHASNMKLEDICAQGLVCILRASNDMAQMFQGIAYSASQVVKDM